MSFELKKLKVGIFFITIFVIACLLALYWFFNHAFLSIKIVQKGAVVTIDNAPLVIKTSGTGKKTLSPGKHTVMAELEGFLAFKQEITLRRGSFKTLEINLTGGGNDSNNAVNSPKNDAVPSGSKLSGEYYLGNNSSAIYKAIVNIGADNGAAIIDNKALTANKLRGIQEIIWAPGRDMALFRKSDGIYLYDFSKYDFVNQTETLFGRDIGSIAWSPDNTKIAYFYSPPSGERTLVFSNINNSTTERVFNFAEAGIENPVIKWSANSQFLLIIPKNKYYTKDNIYIFNIYNRSLAPLTEGGNQVDAVFAPDSQKIIYATYAKDPNQKIPYVISTMKIDGSEKKSMEIRADLRKIAWFKDSRNVLLVAFNQNTNREYVFKLDTESKKTEKGFDNYSENNIDALGLVSEEKILLFESRGKIFSLNSSIF